MADRRLAENLPIGKARVTTLQVNSITFDKTQYKPGDTITVTVNYQGPTSFTFTGTVQNLDNGSSVTGTGTFNVAALSASGSDTGNRTWTVKSDDHVSTAVLTATA
jgi:Peptidase A4 family